MKLDASNFFQYFIIHPNSPDLDKNEKSKAWIATIAVGILTLGIAHAVCAIAFRNYKLKPSDPRLTNVFTNQVPISKKPNGLQNQPIQRSTLPLKALSTVISQLKKGDAVQRKKGYLLEKGQQLYVEKKCQNSLTTHRLKDSSSYFLSKNKSPQYFKEVFKSSNDLHLTATDQFYDYGKTSMKEDYWVDFANASLGGGCFTHGFVQEEIMVAEMPDFADHIAQNQSKKRAGWCDIATRSGKRPDCTRTLKGSPDPYLLKDVHRVQKMSNKSAYGRGFDTADVDTIMRPLDKPQRVNILAIASPKLDRRDREEQFASDNLKDVFNTIVAGLQLVKENARGPFLIHSGPLGCGAFHQDKEAVYFLHCLAAQHLNIEIKLHGYSDRDVEKYNRAWHTLVNEFTEGYTLEGCINAISDSLRNT